MTPQLLLELQLTDTAIDLLRHRMPRLPEAVAAAAAAGEVSAWERRATELAGEIAGFDAAISVSERSNEEISTHRDRLERQLKTVIVPREAEALMHEIARLNAQRAALDDDELEAMDGLAQAEAGLSEHAEVEDLLRTGAAAATAAAATARAASEAELAELIAASDALRARLDSAMLATYDAMRGQHNGVAIAKLNGLRCEGCHLDLSRGEVDTIKRLPDDELAECPNCGRLLVR